MTHTTDTFFVDFEGRELLVEVKDRTKFIIKYPARGGWCRITHPSKAEKAAAVAKFEEITRR